jgi:hypothetical protein
MMPVGEDNRQNLPRLPDERGLLSVPLPTLCLEAANSAQNSVHRHATNCRMRLVHHCE